jgi:hypothetical protein
MVALLVALLFVLAVAICVAWGIWLWKKGVPIWLSSRLSKLEVNPADALRRRMTEGLDISASDDEVRRGADVEALVTISKPTELGDLQVGVVCTEYYDENATDYEGKTSRCTSEACAHEAWLPVDSLTGVQSVRLPIPLAAPFSYEGSCLSFRWEVVARGHRSRRLDAQARNEFSVLP